MPIIAVILLTLTFWGIVWFVRFGGIDRGIDHWRERSARRKDQARLAQVRELGRTAQLRAIDDPREAANVLMLLIPRGGDPTPQQIAAIEKIAVDTFEFNGELVGRMTQARHIAGRAGGFEQAVKTFFNLLNKRLTRDERHELVTMVQDVARYDGPTRVQTEAIAFLRKKLDLPDSDCRTGVRFHSPLRQAAESLQARRTPLTRGTVYDRHYQHYRP